MMRFEFHSGFCTYFDLNSLSNRKFVNSFMHLNVRSVSPKLPEIQGLLFLLGFPKIFMLSEIWLAQHSFLESVENYFFISSLRITNRWGGVGIYIHNSVKYIIKKKSANSTVNNNNIDYIVIQLIGNTNIALACMYCPDKKLNNIVSIIEHIKFYYTQLLDPLIIGGDFNINLLDVTTDLAIDFLHNSHTYSLYPVITLLTRVTKTTSTLIDDFLCDISLLSLCSSVIKTDISDHYLIELSLNLPSSSNTVTKRNFSAKNKLTFSQKLLNAD